MYHLVMSMRTPFGSQDQWSNPNDQKLSRLQSPAIYDSKGVLSILDRFRRPTQARWIPALDTNLLSRREGKQESYWAVGLQEGKFMAVILKVSHLALQSL